MHMPRRHSQANIQQFLQALDKALKKDATLVVIGGSAALLRYHIAQATLDIDIYGEPDAQIQLAAQHARTTTGLNIPLDGAPVADLPINYEDRLEPVDDLGTKRLTIFVPEKYDLVLSKIVRATEHDLQTIEQIHKRYPLQPNELINRYVTEMKYAIGLPRDRDLNLLACIERLFGQAVAQQTENQLNQSRQRT